MAETRRTMPGVVRVLMTARRVSLGDVASALGISRASASARLNGHTRFNADELAALAYLLRVEPEVFFKDPDELVGIAKHSPLFPARAAISSTSELRRPLLPENDEELVAALRVILDRTAPLPAGGSVSDGSWSACTRCPEEPATTAVLDMAA